jgi:hypothetical protein
MAGLEFPERADGRRSGDFLDLVEEIRRQWDKIRGLPYFKRSLWFSRSLAMLVQHAHRRDDADYCSAVGWLAGQVTQLEPITTLKKRVGYRDAIPMMPQVKDNGQIFAFHLVVLHEVLRALGYRGLALIMDEAEHVRGYAAPRYEKASNFFDILSRCAHRPHDSLKEPHTDYANLNVPSFWREGPHFALFVGLTEADDEQDPRWKAQEMSVLVHSPEDVVQLGAPSSRDYEEWCARLLEEAAQRLGPTVSLLAITETRARLARTLGHYFGRVPESEKVLRNWTKLAALPAAVLMSQPKRMTTDELVFIVEAAARQVANDVMPWDD